MALTRRITAEAHTELHEVLQGQYKATSDGHFVLDAPEWDTDRGRVDEFRTTNTDLLKERDTLVTTASAFKDIDPEKAREAILKIQEIDDAKLIEAGDVDKLVAQRVARINEENDAKITAKDTELTAANDAHELTRGLYRDVVIDEAIRTDALDVELGVKRTALPDILLRSKQVWSLDSDGKTPIAKNAEGEILRDEKTGEPLSKKGWIESLRTDNPHLFEGSGGGGGDGSESGRRTRTGEVSRANQDDVNGSIEDIASGKVLVT
jgi:hypothetical protein